MGVESSNFHSLDITPMEYKTHKFIAAFDTEKALGASFTGLNIKQGALMTLKMKSGAAAAQMPDTVYLTLHMDCIMNIKDSGIEIYE